MEKRMMELRVTLRRFGKNKEHYVSIFALQKKFKISENIFCIQKSILTMILLILPIWNTESKIQYRGRRFMYEKVEEQFFKIF